MNGIYVGLHGGGFFGDTEFIENQAAADGGATDGLVGGVLAGINFNSGNWLFGVEGDYGWSSASGTGGEAIQYNYDSDRVAHLRARFGNQITEDILLFFAGGIAWTENVTSEVGNTSGWNGMDLGGTFTGWTAGVGAEFRLFDNIFARIEYLHDDYGSQTYNHGVGHNYTTNFSADIVRGAIVFPIN